jgi:predicted dehydrogenase
MTKAINRRSFIGAATVSGACAIVPRHVLGGKGHVAPSDKITLAHIGMGTQSIRELGGLLADPRLQIVSVCDPNKNSNDYIEWGKNDIRRRICGYLGNANWRAGEGGCPGGRKVGQEIVETYYANQRGHEKYDGCSTYADFRELLEAEPDIDAVKIMTPDHLHATLAIAAMKKGKHVLMHKPIANRLHEGRLVTAKARQTKLATHLLAYGSGNGNARIVDQIKQGVIGKLLEIHNWTNRPVWPQYAAIPQDTPPAPEGFRWDLWLGPSRDRPFHPHYTHTVYRGWYEFGGGSMADMGIYSLWPVFTGLGLDVPISAEALATHTCTNVDNVSRRVKNDFSYPTACTIRLTFAARGDDPELGLFWYDGGMRPRLPRELEAQDVAAQQEGILFVGEEGTILANFGGSNPQLFTNGRHEPLVVDEDSYRNSTGSERHNPWLIDCQGGETSPGSFLSAASITDAVNLGTVALRAGQKVFFDSEKMEITNLSGANKYLRREYREGWEL